MMWRGGGGRKPPCVASAPRAAGEHDERGFGATDRKSTRLNSSHLVISYAVFCLKKKKKKYKQTYREHTIMTYSLQHMYNTYHTLSTININTSRLLESVCASAVTSGPLQECI